jgi:hypothetical protein
MESGDAGLIKDGVCELFSLFEWTVEREITGNIICVCNVDGSELILLCGNKPEN